MWYLCASDFTIENKFHYSVDGLISRTDTQKTDNVLMIEAFHHFGFAEEVQFLFDRRSHFQRLDSYRYLHVTIIVKLNRRHTFKKSPWLWRGGQKTFFCLFLPSLSRVLQFFIFITMKTVQFHKFQTFSHIQFHFRKLIMAKLELKFPRVKHVIYSCKVSDAMTQLAGLLKTWKVAASPRE